MNKKEIKQSLRDALPRGSAKRILSALEDQGINPLPSTSWISRVCNPDSSHWDDDIIREALVIAQAERAKMETFKVKAGLTEKISA